MHIQNYTHIYIVNKKRETLKGGEKRAVWLGTPELKE
jgi:hypothetical protein